MTAIYTIHICVSMFFSLKLWREHQNGSTLSLSTICTFFISFWLQVSSLYFFSLIFCVSQTTQSSLQRLKCSSFEVLPRYPFKSQTLYPKALCTTKSKKKGFVHKLSRIISWFKNKSTLKGDQLCQSYNNLSDFFFNPFLSD